MSEVQIKSTGDSALTVEFENKISIPVNQKVHALVKNMEDDPVHGVIEMVPTYRSVMVYYHPEEICFHELKQIIQKRAASCRVSETESREIIELPVCYGGELGPDIGVVAEHDSLTEDEVIARHSGNLSFVYAVGFSPGLAYIGSPEPTFTIPRLKSPRVKIPRDSIVVWESQTTTIPFDQPCGWHIIGRTPVHLYDGEHGKGSYLKAGQWVKFVPVSYETYQEIRKQAEAGTYEPVIYREG